MSTTKQSKQNYQSDNEFWFQKSNYMYQYLSEESKKIIEKINKKHMKNLIFSFILLPLMSYSQTYYTSGLRFHNEVRSFYDLPILKYNNELSLEAQMWAEHLAATDSFVTSGSNYGENIFWIDKNYAYQNNKNVLLEASINWILGSDDYSTYNQALYNDASNIGFGMAENEKSIYVVAKYDKLYE